MTKFTFTYERGDKFSVTCVVDEHGFVTMHAISVPDDTDEAVYDRFLEEADAAAIKLASNAD